MTQRANVRHFPLKSMPLNVTNNYSRYWNWEVSTAVKSANVKLSEKWNEMKVQWFKVHSKAKSRLLTHLPGRPTSTAVEQSKIVRWSKSPCNQSGSIYKGNGPWRKGFAEEPSLEFRMKHWASKRRCKRW